MRSSFEKNRDDDRTNKRNLRIKRIKLKNKNKNEPIDYQVIDIKKDYLNNKMLYSNSYLFNDNKKLSYNSSLYDYNNNSNYIYNNNKKPKLILPYINKTIYKKKSSNRIINNSCDNIIYKNINNYEKNNLLLEQYFGNNNYLKINRNSNQNIYFGKEKSIYTKSVGAELNIEEYFCRYTIKAHDAAISRNHKEWLFST